MATPDAVEEAPRETGAPKSRQRASSHSGRLLLRMPASLHEELARASDRDGVSLNQFITSALAGAVGWKREDGGPAGTARPSKSRSRRLTFLLAANLVLVAAAAVAAIAFLIAAWLS
jgi:RNA polymerase sigma-B factor